jgi:hypothetical protein
MIEEVAENARQSIASPTPPRPTPRRSGAASWAGVPLSDIGQPYWIIDTTRSGRPFQRIGFTGQRCPRCRRSRVKYMCDPDGPEEGLVCGNPWCGYGREIVRPVRADEHVLAEAWKAIGLHKSNKRRHKTRPSDEPAPSNARDGEMVNA